MSAVKIQTTRSTLPTTHPLHRLKRVRSTFASGSPSLGRVRSLVDYSLQNSSTKRKGQKRGKKPLYLYRAPENGKRQTQFCKFLRVTRNPGDRNPRPWPKRRIEARFCPVFQIHGQAIRLALDVSHPYATNVRRGIVIPHPRHWLNLAKLLGFPKDRNEIRGESRSPGRKMFLGIPTD